MNEISNDNPSSIHIEWVLNNVCNYRCNYCHDDINDGSSGHPDLEKSVKFFDMIHERVNSNNKMITLVGGEPTLWPNLTKFLNSLNENYYTAITTNASRTIRWWRDFITECRRVHRVIISVHLEYVDIEHIVSVCEIIQDKTDVMILLMWDKKYQDRFDHCFERLKNSDLRVSIMIKPIVYRLDENKPRDYTLEERQLIREFKYVKNRGVKLPVASKIIVDGVTHPPNYGNYMISSDLNRFRGWSCSAGSTRLVIWHDGTVYPANCSTAKKYPMGNINDPENFIRINEIICESDYCGCWPDIRIPKRKRNNE